MGGPSSKRKLKSREKVSLRNKAQKSVNVLDAAAQSALLSEELRSELRHEGVDQLVLLSDGKAEKAAKEERKAAAAAAEAQVQMSKGERRKLEQIRRKKEQQARLADSFQQLQETQLSAGAMELLQSSSTRGGKETRRQLLKRGLQMHRVGLAVPADSRLFVRVDDAAERDQLSDASDSDAGGFRPAPATQGVHVGKVMRKRARPADSATSDDDVPTREQAAAPGAASTVLPPGGRDSSDDDDDAKDGAAPLVKRDLSRVAPPVQVTFKPKGGPAAHEESSEDEAAAVARRAAERAERQRVSKLVAEIKRSEGIPDTRRDEADEPQRQRSVPSMGPTRVRYVQRPPDIQAARDGLPILAMEQEVMQAVDEHDVILLCGETGCGKTTQVPQFLYEAGYGSNEFPERRGIVGVTQPRRVAAVSTAKRVAAELATEIGGDVGYHVRYDAVAGAGTAIKFMTDGILMRELQTDFLLRRYSVLLIDEAHERSLNTDLLLGMLSRIVPQRRAQHLATLNAPPADRVFPLKLIIMSATLRIDDFLENERLFPPSLYPGGPPPVVNVPARQYPVLVHFSKRTELDDYTGAAYKKVARIHRELPPGGILVFMTGQREVAQLCSRIKQMFPGLHRGHAHDKRGANGKASQAPPEYISADAAMELDGADRAEVDAHFLDNPVEDEPDFDALVDDMESSDSEEEEEVVQLGGTEMTPEELAAAEAHFEAKYGLTLAKLGADGAAAPADGSGAARSDLQRSSQTPVHVLPLYAMLPPQEQAAVFADPPPGHRLIVVATNVAETSLTIPGIRYVVDAGRAKAKLLEAQAGLHRFEVRWISKASSDQRAGRAGRTGPGHCYRLFSSACFNDLFPQHSPPEILNTALEGVILVMRAMGLPKILNFPFPTPPERGALLAAERCLVNLSALAVTAEAASAKLASGTQLELTTLGKAMAAFPISPRHSRMLLEAATLAAATASAADALPYALALAAVLSSEPPFLHADACSAGEAAAPAATPPPDAAVAKRKRIAEDNANNTQRNKARSAHHRLRSPQSDAVSALNALIAFEAQPRPARSAFCKENFLHAANLSEMSALRAQLARIVRMKATLEAGAMSGHPGASFLLRRAALEGAGAGSVSRLDAPLTPPGTAVSTILRRCVAAGWADQVARRMRSAEHVAQQNTGKGPRAVRYQGCMLEDEIFLHPRSSLHAVAPDHIVYLSLVRTEKRPYMSTITTVEASWLAEGTLSPLATVSDPVREPSPFYSRPKDAVLAWCEVTYGMHAWPLPLVAVPHPDKSERCGHFAAALLSGKVLPSFGQLGALYNCKPSMACTPEGRALQRVSLLVGALASAGVESKASLRERWAVNAVFLKAEVAGWLQKGHAKKLEALWPTLLREAAATDVAVVKPLKKKTRGHL